MPTKKQSRKTNIFSLWSESSSKAIDNISPKIPFRDWDSLSLDDKENILMHFRANGWFRPYDEDIVITLVYLIEKYKKENLCPKTLRYFTTNEYLDMEELGADLDDMDPELEEAAEEDFNAIFLNCRQDIVLEFLSYYATRQIRGRNRKWFRHFSDCLNEIFEDFAINFCITNSGLLPRQDKKVLIEIYEPVFKFLADPSWKAVNIEIENCIKAFRKKEYDESIRSISNAIQAYLQVLVHGRVGKGKIGELIIAGRKKNLIPNNSLTNDYLKIIQKHLGKERANKSGAHPRLEKPIESDARLNMNLAFVTLQYWFQYSADKDY